MERKIDIQKSAGVLIKDHKFLITRSKGKDFFVSPGGKIEKGESAREALKRELYEELSIHINLLDLKEFGTFYAPAVGQEDKYLQMHIYLVTNWTGEITPAAEVEETLWIGSELPVDIKLGSIFHHHVQPKLKEQGLIK